MTYQDPEQEHTETLSPSKRIYDLLRLRVDGFFEMFPDRSRERTALRFQFGRTASQDADGPAQPDRISVRDIVPGCLHITVLNDELGLETHFALYEGYVHPFSDRDTFGEDFFNDPASVGKLTALTTEVVAIEPIRANVLKHIIDK